MRSDGAAIFYFVQHEQKAVNGTDSRRTEWVESDLGHFLFSGLQYTEKQGVIGDAYRALMAPQEASSPLWQKFGIHGYTEKEDAFKVLEAVRERNPDRKFRVVKRTIMQQTEVMVGGRW